MFLTVLFSANALLIAGCIWTLWCNSKTYRQRSQMFPKPGDPMFWEKSAAMDEVSYNAHLFALMTFRNPRRLYSAVLMGAVA